MCHRERLTLGRSILALSHEGNPLFPPLPPDHPPRRGIVCHPVPIDSTTGCSSAVLFIGLSLPRLLPQPICVTQAPEQQIQLCLPDGISTDITFEDPRSSREEALCFFFFFPTSFSPASTQPTPTIPSAFTFCVPRSYSQEVTVESSSLTTDGGGDHGTGGDASRVFFPKCLVFFSKSLRRRLIV